jgi:hypothetical protein
MDVSAHMVSLVHLLGTKEADARSEAGRRREINRSIVFKELVSRARPINVCLTCAMLKFSAARRLPEQTSVALNHSPVIAGLVAEMTNF